MKVSQGILKHEIEFVSGFILRKNPSTNYPLRIQNFFYLAISGRFISYEVFHRYTNYVFQVTATGLEPTTTQLTNTQPFSQTGHMYFEVKQFNSKTLMQCNTKYMSY